MPKAETKPVRRYTGHAGGTHDSESLLQSLDFALFLKARWTEKGASKATPQESTKLILHTLPASHLDRLTGLVSWGGDAVADAERLYDDHS